MVFHGERITQPIAQPTFHWAPINPWHFKSPLRSYCVLVFKVDLFSCASPFILCFEHSEIQFTVELIPAFIGWLIHSWPNRFTVCKSHHPQGFRWEAHLHRRACLEQAIYLTKNSSKSEQVRLRNRRRHRLPSAQRRVLLRVPKVNQPSSPFDISLLQWTISQLRS